MIGVNAYFRNITTYELGIVISEYSLATPEIQEHKLEVIGRDGLIDLSDAYGKVAYRNRELTINLHDVRQDRKVRRNALRKLMTAIHGKASDLVMSDAPEYTIRGRWHVEVATDNRFYSEYTITGDCYPFRHRGTYTFLINAAGGIILDMPSGDQAVTPTIEVQRRTLVTYEGKAYWLEPGTWKIRDIYFRGGTNRIIINTYPEYSGGAKLSDYAGMQIKELGGKRIYELAAGDNPIQVPDKLSDYAGKRIYELAGKKLIELAHSAQPGDEHSAYLQYEWSDF